MIEESFKQLYPRREWKYEPIIKYSGQFSAYNANVRLKGEVLEFRLSKDWEDIGEEIKKGLIQHLLLKMFGGKKQTTLQIELYTNFIKNLAKYTPKVHSDPILDESFDRVNAAYFDGQMEKPNLKWGTASYRQLGLYNYHDDSVTISTLFTEHLDVLDYILYHELLHKQEKFEHKNGRSHHHTSRFRALEKQFANQPLMEKKIEHIVRSARRSTTAKPRRKRFSWW